mmetsp:Transcript_13682/g.22848  ORF Transcript_13682/g.22848 Transcript_13682/m.22848 type:complete len:284 (+) Transcript_13682:1791-2642(+)
MAQFETKLCEKMQVGVRGNRHVLHLGQLLSGLKLDDARVLPVLEPLDLLEALDITVLIRLGGLLEMEHVLGGRLLLLDVRVDELMDVDEKVPRLDLLVEEKTRRDLGQHLLGVVDDQREGRPVEKLDDRPENPGETAVEISELGEDFKTFKRGGHGRLWDAVLDTVGSFLLGDLSKHVVKEDRHEVAHRVVKRGRSDGSIVSHGAEDRVDREGHKDATEATGDRLVDVLDKHVEELWSQVGHRLADRKDNVGPDLVRSVAEVGQEDLQQLGDVLLEDGMDSFP